MAVYSLLIAVATVLETQHGTAFVKVMIYYSPLFIFLQILMILNFIFVTLRYKLISNKKWSYMIVHLAYIVILIGAFVTHVTSHEGLMHIREGQKTNLVAYEDQDGSYHEFRVPFEIELIDFKIDRYPGSNSPSSYESMLRVYDGDNQFEQKVYMNNVLDLKGYRFYQASYDQDELGTILSVNYDVIGRIITYIGYFLLILSFLVMLFDKNSRFRLLWNKLENKTEDNFVPKKIRTHTTKSILALVFCSFLSIGLYQETVEASPFDISREHAELFGTLPIQSASGRIIPINTLASEFVRKFGASSKLHGMTDEQALLSFMVYPGTWSKTPFIEVKNKELLEKYGWKDKVISYRDAFDKNGRYRLAKDVELIYIKNPSRRNHLEREILKLDDKLNILHELISNRMLRMFPNSLDTVNYRWYAAGESEFLPKSDFSNDIRSLSNKYYESVANAVNTKDWTYANSMLNEIKEYQIKHDISHMIDEQKLKIERLYNLYNLPIKCLLAYLVLGILMLIAFFFEGGEKKNKLTPVKKGLIFLTILALIVHTISLGMRWYISGYAPWSNSYETMVFLSWAGVLGGFVFIHRNFLVLTLATLFGALVLLFSNMSWMDPQITPLVPVLKSPWLLAHVAILIVSYGFLGICCMIGTAYLCMSCFKKYQDSFLLKQMSIINELSMILAVALLAIGIFLGAIWANESWGRYWSWDPKESWSLISLIIYAIVMHLKIIRKDDDYLFNLLSQISFLSILMTFLGVNYFLTGMHSYGNNDALSSIPIVAYIAFVLFFTAPGILSYVKLKKKN